MRTILFCLMLGAPLGAWAQSADQQPAVNPENTTVTTEAPKAATIICVRGQAETGSHFGAAKVCHTQAEWDMIHNQTRSTLERSQAAQQTQSPGR